MMNLIQLDAIKVALAQGRTPMYADRDVFQVMRQDGYYSLWGSN